MKIIDPDGKWKYMKTEKKEINVKHMEKGQKKV